MFSPSTMFLIFFCPALKVAKPAQIQPKYQFLFHKNLLLLDCSIMTLTAPYHVATLSSGSENNNSDCMNVHFFSTSFILQTYLSS